MSKPCDTNWWLCTRNILYYIPYSTPNLHLHNKLWQVIRDNPHCKASTIFQAFTSKWIHVGMQLYDVQNETHTAHCNQCNDSRRLVLMWPSTLHQTQQWAGFDVTIYSTSKTAEDRFWCDHLLIHQRQQKAGLGVTTYFAPKTAEGRPWYDHLLYTKHSSGQALMWPPTHTPKTAVGRSWCDHLFYTKDIYMMCKMQHTLRTAINVMTAEGWPWCDHLL